MSDKSLDLLSDLLRLVRKYGAAEFEQLATLLSDAEFRDKAVTILRGVTKIADPAASPTSMSSTAATIDPKRDELISTARSRVGDTKCYPHLRDLADDLARLGLRVPSAGYRKREDAIRAVTKHLSELPIEQVGSFVDQLRTTKGGSELEEWSKIIMERKP